MYKLFVLIILYGFSIPIWGQTLFLGLRTDAVVYFENNSQHNTSKIYGAIPLLSAYLKAEIQYGGYGLDFKGGFQMGNPFFGSEYGVELKYNIAGIVWPLIACLKHINGSTDGNTTGTYTEPIYFIGAGVEAEMTKLFSLDLILYLPAGNNKLKFSRDDLSDPDKLTVLSRIGPLIKIGFIFNILRI